MPSKVALVLISNTGGRMITAQLLTTVSNLPFLGCIMHLCTTPRHHGCQVQTYYVTITSDSRLSAVTSNS